MTTLKATNFQTCEPLTIERQSLREVITLILLLSIKGIRKDFKLIDDNSKTTVKKKLNRCLFLCR